MNIESNALAIGVSSFYMDVLHGLSATPKSLPCKWFYDETGSGLFEAITQTPEYYLTRVESRLLSALLPALIAHIPDLAIVIEPGSGASIKTRLLLNAITSIKQYVPIDISEEFLLQNAAQLKTDFPKLAIQPIVADFTHLTHSFGLDETLARMIFFPGSTIGNFAPNEAKQLLTSLRMCAGKNVWMLLGLDMTQESQKLLAAYNDEAGITARFNLNLLQRANMELNTNFNLAQFKHQAIFNQSESRVEMHLISRQAQSVEMNGRHFHFAENESIHTENSYKYSQLAIETLLAECGWQITQQWQDEVESAFGIYLLKSAES